MGDPLAELIHRTLLDNPAGLTLTELHELGSAIVPRHRSGKRSQR